MITIELDKGHTELFKKMIGVMLANTRNYYKKLALQRIYNQLQMKLKKKISDNE